MQERLKMGKHSLLLITDSFPPGFAPRMGYFCKYLRQHTDWRVTAIHNVCHNGREGEHAATFGHLCGYVDKEYEYLPDDGIHSCPPRRKLVQFLGGECGMRELVEFFIGKVCFKLTNRGTDFSGRRAVRRALREGRFDLILGSSGGGRPYELADYAGRISGIPVVQDFRDIIEGLEQIQDNWRYRRRMSIRNQCVCRAAAICVTCKDHRDVLNRVLVTNGIDSKAEPDALDWSPDMFSRACQSEKMLSIMNATMEKTAVRQKTSVSLVYNGYDPDVFGTVKKVPADKFEIAYVGSVYAGADFARPMFEGLVAFLARPDVAQHAVVKFYSSELTFEKQILPHVPKDLANLFVRMPSVQQSELPKELASVSVLLTLSHGTWRACGSISTKILEYLAMGIPILDYYFEEEREEEEIIRNCSPQSCVTDSPEGMVRFLRREYDRFRQRKEGLKI